MQSERSASRPKRHKASPARDHGPVESAYLIAALVGALWLGLSGLRGVPDELRQGPDSLKPPRWWLWSESSWLATERASVVGTFFMLAIVPAAALRLLGLEDSAATLAIAVLLGVCLLLVVSTTLFGRPAALVPRRLRGGPNVLAEWFVRGDGGGGWPDRK